MCPRRPGCARDRAAERLDAVGEPARPVPRPGSAPPLRRRGRAGQGMVGRLHVDVNDGGVRVLAALVSVPRPRSRRDLHPLRQPRDTTGVELDRNRGAARRASQRRLEAPARPGSRGGCRGVSVSGCRRDTGSGWPRPPSCGRAVAARDLRADGSGDQCAAAEPPRAIERDPADGLSSDWSPQPALKRQLGQIPALTAFVERSRAGAGGQAGCGCWNRRRWPAASTPRSWPGAASSRR